LISDYLSIKRFTFKHQIYKILKKNNLISYNWYLIKNRSKLISIIEKHYCDKDFVIKPSKSRGGRDVYIFKKKIRKKYSKNRDREKYFPHNLNLIKKLIFKTKFDYPLILMDCLYGPIYDLDILAFKGKIVQFAIRERIGPQGIRGNVVKKFDRRYFSLGKKVTHKLKLSWLYDFDIMHNSKGKPQILEINPRQSGSIFNSLKAGHPIYESLIFLAKKNKLQKLFRLTKSKKFVY